MSACAFISASVDQKRTFDPLELGLQVVLSHLTWVLRTELGPPTRAASSLNHCTLPSACPSTTTGHISFFFLKPYLVWNFKEDIVEISKAKSRSSVLLPASKTMSSCDFYFLELFRELFFVCLFVVLIFIKVVQEILLQSVLCVVAS